MRHTHGSIEVVCGSMFSGKTDELIRRLVRATIAKQNVQVFKPSIDVRYAVEKVTSHAGSDYDASPVENAADIRAKLDGDTTVFPKGSEVVCYSFSENGSRITSAASS